MPVLNRLPLELVEDIVKQLYDADEREALVAFAQCSQSSRSLVYTVSLRNIVVHQIMCRSLSKARSYIKHLKSLLALPHLHPYIQHLTISGDEPAPRPILCRFIALLYQFTALKSLTFRNCEFNLKQTESLISALTNRSNPIRSLSLQSSSFQQKLKDDFKLETIVPDDEVLEIAELEWIHHWDGYTNYPFCKEFLSKSLTSLSIRIDNSTDVLSTFEILSTQSLPLLSSFKWEAGTTKMSQLNNTALPVFLDRTPSIVILRIGSFNYPLNLSPMALPGLRVVQAGIVTLKELIPGRPLEEVEWSGAHHTPSALDDFCTALSKATTARIRILRLMGWNPPLNTFAKLTKEIKSLELLEVATTLGRLTQISMQGNTFYYVQRLRVVDTFNFSQVFNNSDVSKIKDSILPPLLDMFPNLTQINWISIRSFEWSKVGEQWI